MQLPYMESKTKPDYFNFSPITARIIIPDLQTLIPENSIDYILNWFKVNPVHLRIAKARTSKFGDYRGPINNIPARISVNKNLNRFDFLITLVHEMAHHEVWVENNASGNIFDMFRRKRRPRPHGQEWKNHYLSLMVPLLKDSIFPEDVLFHLVSHIKNPHSSSKSNEYLVGALNKYNEPDDSVFIESLAYGTIFRLPAGRIFRKQEKLRKRYRCVCFDNGRIYLFSPKARVIPKPT